MTPPDAPPAAPPGRVTAGDGAVPLPHPRGHLHLAVALDGAGWHPAAWREPGARPGELFTGRYWADLVREAEAGLLDLVTLEDALRLQSDDPRRPDGRTDRVRGRLDAVLVAARVALVTRSIGLVPSATATHTEPFHASKAIATLDHVSRGRAGVRVQVAARPDEAAHFGRRPEIAALAPGAVPGAALAEELFEEAREWIDVVRRLWDSWEDDAEIRDTATGRFVDRDKLHEISDPSAPGGRFSVKGPSITPRPPQGQPLVAALSHVPLAHRLVATSTDLGFLTPHDADGASALVAEVRAAQAAAGRGGEPLRLLGDVVVALDDRPGAAAARLERLDEAAGGALPTDALVFAGTPSELADLALEWREAGLDGLRLRPAVLPDDLRAITRALVPELQRRGAFRSGYAEATLRERLGLPRPANRFVGA